MNFCRGEAPHPGWLRCAVMRPTDEAHGTPGRAVERRTLLLAGAVGAALTGCSLNNPFSTDKTPAAEAVRDLSPDVAVAVEAVTLLLAAGAAVEATAGTHPALSARLTGLTATHRAHVAALSAAVPDRVDVTADPAPYVVPLTRSAALVAVRRSETALQAKLVGLALRAESGPFARLLGTMSAALSQQLAVLGQ